MEEAGVGRPGKRKVRGKMRNHSRQSGKVAHSTATRSTYTDPLLAQHLRRAPPAAALSTRMRRSTSKRADDSSGVVLSIPPMFLFDVLGLGLTLCTLALLALGGYLLALRLLGTGALEDPLALAIATLLAATAEAVGIALLLGALGVLRLELGLALADGADLSSCCAA